LAVAVAAARRALENRLHAAAPVNSR